ncbi:MAG TPA: SDR family NAD(P)-dependent oxidoreductase [Spirochaetota bacterium]|nr:SDR family NAD(P)-dependent oxidoreductase [Spirochaetota bacterium]HPC39383.1 SDR family NAD(P)-dependent oxidoreductase [Spirochaetota bacterium]HQF06720.1 SDR family NAD(P)-dependent oxidoreductase [Spirochaetota bacterium]HQH95661.1 SDR family NAD(P)-dependent oxidoreductase [Spirochaetota bacterium]HQJ69239.1 SDR family NAD(P)-dependent oxidoreductase [Spirochaetota bacterium]
MQPDRERQSKPYALVTGASSGLGESFAHDLARRGHDLVLVSENLKELERVKADIESQHDSSVFILEADLFHPAAAERVFDFCLRKRISIDILINNAGIYLNIERELNDIKSVENVINLHVMSLAKLCFLFCKEMMERKLGYILNVSSINSEFPDPASLTYGPTKRFILAFTESLHCEMREHNVHVTCLTPGGIKTNFFTANDVFIPPVIRRTLLSSDECARKSLDALFRGRARITPGLSGKIQSFFLRLMTRPSTYHLIKKSYFSMKKKST